MARKLFATDGKAYEAISVASGVIFAQPMEAKRSRQRSQSTAAQRMSDRAFESRPQKAAQRNKEVSKKSLFAACFWLRHLPGIAFRIGLYASGGRTARNDMQQAKCG